MNNLFNLQKRHEISQSHVDSLLALKQFGKTRIEYALSEQFKINIKQHNDMVKQNRYILRCLIDVVCFWLKMNSLFVDMMNLWYRQIKDIM